MLARAILVTAVMAVFTTADSGVEKICEGLVPDEQVEGLMIPLTADSNVTEEQFNEIMDRVEQVYTPYIAENFGGKFEVERLWESETVNAYASRQGESWMIHMHGGLARYPIMSPGGMLLVACHEVGHHLGGAPKKGLRWASSEGQSDYYGTLRCVRELLNGWTPSWDFGPIDASAAAACDNVYANQEERELCYVSAMMGQDLGSVLSDLGRSGAVHFDTPDTREVRRTSDSHPRGQCRLDTYFQGALCSEGADKRLSDIDPSVGTCWAAEGMRTGSRRRCWFQPTDFADDISQVLVSKE